MTKVLIENGLLPLILEHLIDEKLHFPLANFMIYLGRMDENFPKQSGVLELASFGFRDKHTHTPRICEFSPRMNLADSCIITKWLWVHPTSSCNSCLFWRPLWPRGRPPAWLFRNIKSKRKSAYDVYSLGHPQHSRVEFWFLVCTQNCWPTQPLVAWEWDVFTECVLGSAYSEDKCFVILDLPCLWLLDWKGSWWNRLRKITFRVFL